MDDNFVAKLEHKIHYFGHEHFQGQSNVQNRKNHGYNSNHVHVVSVKIDDDQIGLNYFNQKR